MSRNAARAARLAAWGGHVVLEALWPSRAVTRACEVTSMNSAASATADRPAEVSADQHPAPSAGHPDGLDWLGRSDRDSLWVLSDPPHEPGGAIYGWYEGEWCWTTDGKKWFRSHAQRGAILPTGSRAQWIPYTGPIQTSAGTPAAVDDPAGVLPPSPAGSPTPDEWRRMLGQHHAVPAAVSARSDCDAALPAGHDPSDLIIALCNQVENYRNGVPMTGQRWAYLDELLDESMRFASTLVKSEAAARIATRLQSAADMFPQHQR